MVYLPLNADFGESIVLNNGSEWCFSSDHQVGTDRQLLFAKDDKEERHKWAYASLRLAFA